MGVGGRHTGLPPAQQHAQADIGALGAFGLFEGPCAHIDGDRPAAHGHRIRGLCPGGLRRAQQRACDGVQRVGHTLPFPSAKR